MNDININNITIPCNYVLIRLNDDHNTYHSVETGNDTKISVAPWGINQASHMALTGKVIKTPEKLVYNGWQMNKLKTDSNRSKQEQQHIADLRRQSIAYDVPMEITEGDTVYFEYTTRLNAVRDGRVISDNTGRYVFIPYDMLVLVFKPGTDFENVQVNEVYPLNGFVLIKPLEYATERNSEGVVGYKTERDLFLPVSSEQKYVRKNNIWYGNVLICGCGVSGYADFPDKGGYREKESMWWLKPGVKILYDGRQQKRLEVEHHRVIFKKHVLYRVHRKDILGYLPDGRVNGMPSV